MKIKLTGFGPQKDSPAQKFLDDVEAHAQVNPINDRMLMIGPVGIELSKFGNEIHFSDITTLDQHNQGHATRVLKWLTGLADKHGVTISGTAKAYSKDPRQITNTKRLVQWYKKNGFQIGGGDSRDGYDITYTPKTAATESYVGYIRQRLNEKAVDITATPAFRQWFGNSVVVDAQKRPLKVYHGTKAEFDAFVQPNQKGFNALGFWFTAVPSEAETFAMKYNLDTKEKTYGQIMPVYLRIERPLEFADAKQFWQWAENYALRHGDGLPKPGIRNWAGANPEKIRERLRLGNKDGIVIRGGGAADSFETAGDWFIVLDANQIKSALNTGAFDPNNPNIGESQ